MMNDERKISLCITNHNRFDMLFESFHKVLNDSRISEIIISDDCSDKNIFNAIKNRVDKMNKVKIFRNNKNVGMSKNKMIAVSKSSNKFCILFDSDNVIDSFYIDRLYAIPYWYDDIIYAPYFAQPKFNYADFSGKTIDATSVKRYIDQPMFDCFLNTCNYFVNKKMYVDTYEYNPEMKASDTIYFNYLWLKSGRSFFIVPGMEYYHRVHGGSGFIEDLNYNMKKHNELREEIRAVPEVSDKIITCNLMGRCGNQMFQIATTMGVAIKYGLKYKIPKQASNPSVWKTYFNHLPELTDRRQVKRICKERTHAYQKIPNLDGMRLEGYWQSEKYFNHCREHILDVFGFNQGYIKGATSIHVRRGDFINYPNKHPLCSIEYYDRAINYFIGKGYERFIVFSDDMEWCKKNITSQRYKKCAFEYSEGRDELRDMEYMSQCENNIISNSSFGWWGAWLNRNKDKIIIAPLIWFGIGNAHLDTKDLIPEGWIRM